MAEDYIGILTRYSRWKMITSTDANQTIIESNPVADYIIASSISSIRMISEAVQMDEGAVLEQIEMLIDSGVLNGYITEDRTRFFKSDFKLSKAPSIRSNAEELVIEYADTRSSRYAMIGGFASIVGGLITRAIAPLSEILQSIGASFVLIGMVILAGGWLFLSKQTSAVKQV